MTPEELAADGIQPLPGSLNEARGRRWSVRARGRDPRRARLRVVHPQQAGRVGRLQDRTSASSSSTATSRCSRALAQADSSTTADGTAAVLPRSASRPSSPLALERAGYPWKALADPSTPRPTSPRTAGRGRWSAPSRRRRRLRRCAGWCAARDVPLRPLLLVVAPAQLGELRAPRGPLRRLLRAPAPRAEEVAARLAHLFWRTGRGLRRRAHRARSARAQPRDLPGGGGGAGPRPHLHGVRAAPLPGRAARARSSPARRCCSRVWGYEYYGGARTVDVHVRRLRAKLGEEHAHLIETVRSVGYRFGTVRWLPSDHGSGRR